MANFEVNSVENLKMNIVEAANNKRHNFLLIELKIID
jgi:hypothetical protein